MEPDLAQLRALSAVVEEGSLEAAAGRLHVTPSAVSQRLQALERHVGQVVLVRSRPVRATAAGEALLRLSRQVELLTDETAAELEGGTGTAGARRLPIAVNADSLSTWLLPALAPLAATFAFELHSAGEEHTTALLREGTVMAAITSVAAPLPGCRSELLGTLRYRAMATPAFCRRWFSGGLDLGLAAAPVIVFDGRDHLHADYLRGRAVPDGGAPVHRIPSATDILTAVRLGLGWSVMPDLQTHALERAGELVALDPTASSASVLHWQQWRLHSTALDAVAAALRVAARAHLQPG